LSRKQFVIQPLGAALTEFTISISFDKNGERPLAVIGGRPLGAPNSVLNPRARNSPKKLGRS
jgi:hypothetical protein